MESLSDGLVRVAMPHLGELSEKLGETVVPEVISGTSGTIAYVVQGKRALIFGLALDGECQPMLQPAPKL